MPFDNGHGKEIDPLAGMPVYGTSPEGQVVYNPEHMDDGRIQPILNPTIGDFLTLPVGTEVIFYNARPPKGESGIFVMIVTQAALDDWKDVDPTQHMGWTMIMYLLPEEDKPKGPF